jgi:predicted Zn finger-like uncharacterized protein
MLVECEQCHAKYKITIKKSPGKPVRFKCGKCQNMILIPAESPSAAPAKIPTTIPAPKGKPSTLQCTCLKCGTSFIKQARDKSRLCYQCRIDAIVSKTREKAGSPAPAKMEDKAAHRYTIRNPDGLILGPIKLRTVTVLVREKRIHGNEEVQKDEGPFKPLLDFPELAQFFPHLKPGPEEEAKEEKPAEAAGEKEELIEEEIEIPLEEERESLAEEAEAAPAEPEARVADAGAPVEEKAGEEKEEEEVEEGAAMLDLDEVSGLRAEVEEEAEAAPSPVDEEEEKYWAELQDKVKKSEEIVAKGEIPETLEEELEPPMEKAEPEEEEEEIEELEELVEEAEGAGEVSAGPEPEDTARYRVRYSDGMVLGPVKISTIKDLFTAGNLTGQEEIQREEGSWEPITECEGLKHLFAPGDDLGEDEVIELTEILEEVD